MSQIKGKNTKPEETVRKYLFGRGLRYRKNDKRLPGHPDIVLPKYKTVVLVMVVFDMCMRDVNILNGLRAMWNSGKIN